MVKTTESFVFGQSFSARYNLQTESELGGEKLWI
jgi:hypothetical protein